MDNLLNVNATKEEIKRALDLMIMAQKTVQEVRITGLGKLSRSVLNIARQNNIELNKDIELMKHLARLESSQKITEELYPAVAEILARMYRVSQQAYMYN
jgi:type III secretion system FlhB-like substrate exporter